MADRTCDTCGTRFQYPTRLSRHLNSKIPCRRPGEENQRIPCEICGKTFAHIGTLNRHKLAYCKGANQPAIVNNGDLQGGINNIVGDHNTINHNENIVINVFGKEDLSHITPAMLIDAVGQGGGTNAIIGRLMRMIYSDRPENRNVYLPNKDKGTFGYVYEGDPPHWVPRAMEELHPVAVEKASELFFSNRPDVWVGGNPVPVNQRIDAFNDDLIVNCPVAGPSKEILKGTAPIHQSMLIANHDALKRDGKI